MKMAILQDNRVRYGSDQSRSSTSLEVDEFIDEKSLNDSNAGSGSPRCKYESFSDMLLWLKSVASDPCNQKASSVEVVQLCSQILKAQKVLSLGSNEFPWRKRKIDQLLRETSTSDLLLDKPNVQSLPGLSRGQFYYTSSIPCLIRCSIGSAVSDEIFEKILHNPHSSVRSLKFSDNLSRKRIPKGPSFQADALVSLDSDGSGSGSNPLSPKKQVPQTPHESVELLKLGKVSPLLDSSNSFSSSNLWSPKNLRQHQISHSSFHIRKRRIDQLLEETSTSELHPETPNDRNFNGLSRGQCSYTSSIPCLISCADSNKRAEQILHNPHSSLSPLKSGDNVSRKHIPKDPSLKAEAFDWSSTSGKKVLLSLNSDDSDSGSNPLNPKKQVSQIPHKSVKLQKLGKVSPLLNSDISVSSSNLSSPEKPRQHQTPRSSVKSLNFIGDYFPRMAIPVGPRFQADVPDWIGPPVIENSSNGDSIINNSKWLGTQIWPIKGRHTKTNQEVIGKGRPFSCSCNTSGSPNCIRRHIIEKRIQLRYELGPAFFSWRFDEMGEEVSKKWTVEEQNSFKILVKMNPVSKNKSFWNLVLKCFASKCRESIVSYYFNVFILRRMSRQTRLGSAVIDSDDDEADENAGSSMGKKNQYLNGLR